MGSLTVRVVPRSGRTAVEVGREVLIRVRAHPEGGKATEEARATLARALDVPTAAVSLRRGPRSRVKVFWLAGMTEDQALQRLRRS